jgi:hypothetical protein
MDMRIYYNKIHSVEQTLQGNWIIIISLETPEGGRAGIPAEVSRRNAARLIVEGRGRLATDEEAREFRQAQADAKRAYDDAQAASRVQVTLVPAAELQNFKSGNRPSKA